jgi:hypothetical protein
MCHPGRPSPQVEGHLGSLGFAAFHSAKSSLFLFSPFSLVYASSVSASLIRFSLPYLNLVSNALMSKYTELLD